MVIPKRIFFYWGNNKMSWMRYMTLKSFRRLNPDWEMILYTSSSKINYKIWKTKNYQDFFCYEGVDYRLKLGDLNISIVPFECNDNLTPSHTSNFLKWQELATKGGIYSDMDILYFKPIDEFYDKIKDYDTAICQTDYLSIGLLASSGNNKFYQDIYNNAFKSFNKNYYQSAGIETIYNLYECSLSNVLNRAKLKYPELKFYNIPMDIVYPYDSKNIVQAFSTPCEASELPDETIGYHWYAGHRKSQDYNNILTEDNYTKYNTLFSKILKNTLNKK